MIESVVISAVEKQGVVAALLAFMMVRFELMFRRCLSQHYEVNTTLLTMLGDLLCDQNDSEMCKRFSSFKEEINQKIASWNERSGQKKKFFE